MVQVHLKNRKELGAMGVDIINHLKIKYMGTREIDLEQMADVIKAIAHYNELPNYFAQLSDKAKEFWKEKFPKGMDLIHYGHWKKCNVHIVNQMWANTSGGWQTIGGSAVTNSYTVVIESVSTGLALIYYNGNLAYIADMDNRWWDYAAKGYQHLPGVASCVDYLTIIHNGPKK